MYPASQYSSHCAEKKYVFSCVLVGPPPVSLAVQFNEVVSIVEHAPDGVNQPNITCHSVDLVKQ